MHKRLQRRSGGLPDSAFLERDRCIIDLSSESNRLDETRLGIACVKGQGRVSNADFVLVEDKVRILGEDYLMWGLFDGVTTSKKPDLASKLAAQEFHVLSFGGLEVSDPKEFMRTGLYSADVRLHQGGVGHTTASVALYNPSDRKLTVGHTGDSRVYVFEGGNFVRLTPDQRHLNMEAGDESPRIMLSSVVGGGYVMEDIQEYSIDGNPVLCFMTDGIFLPLATPKDFSFEAAYRAIKADFDSPDTLISRHSEIIRRHTEDPDKLKKAVVKALKNKNLMKAAESLVKAAGKEGNGLADDASIILARLA